MVKYETKKAFTLVETIVTLTIVMLVVAMGMPTLTKKKTQPESVGLRGQYGCWYEGSTLYEQYYDERTPREAPKAVSTCKLRLDKRPSNFYIIATGSGSSATSGELITRFTPTIDTKMTIKPAKVNSTTPTIITNSYGDKIEARSGASVSSILTSSNLKACKLHSSGKNCPNGAKDSFGNTKIQQYCDLVAVIDESKITYNVRINGCESFDSSGNPETTHIIPITVGATSGALDFESNRPVCSYPYNYVAISNSYTGTYKYNNSSYGSNTYVVSFDFHNSNFVPDLYSMESQSSIVALSLLERSKMSRILSSMPHRRRSELTQQFIDANYGGPNKDGAVLVLW